jgi:hypothetical protein
MSSETDERLRMRASIFSAAGIAAWAFGAAVLWAQTPGASGTNTTTVLKPVSVRALSDSLATNASVATTSVSLERLTNSLGLVPAEAPAMLGLEGSLTFSTVQSATGAVGTAVSGGLTTENARPTEALSLFREPRPNEVYFGRFVLSGVLVEAVKTRKPWQLINPFASSDFGNAEDNVLKDPVNGSVSGLKVFSLRF